MTKTVFFRCLHCEQEKRRPTKAPDSAEQVTEWISLADVMQHIMEHPNHTVIAEVMV